MSQDGIFQMAVPALISLSKFLLENLAKFLAGKLGENRRGDWCLYALQQHICQVGHVYLKHVGVLDTLERIMHLHRVFTFCVHIFSADQALDRFAMKRFYEDKAMPVGQPSQRRSANTEYPEYMLTLHQNIHASF